MRTLGAPTVSRDGVQRDLRRSSMAHRLRPHGPVKTDHVLSSPPRLHLRKPSDLLPSAGAPADSGRLKALSARTFADPDLARGSLVIKYKR